MPRIPYPVVEDLPDSVRRTVEAAGLNALRMFAHATPAAFEHLYALTSVFFTASRVAADLRQIAVLRVGHVAGCDYVIRQHGALARDIGLSQAAIDAVASGGAHPGLLTEAQQAALDFADQTIRDARPSDAALAAIRRHLDDNQLVDLTMAIGIYMTMARLIETTGAEVDDHKLDLDKIHG